MMPIELCVVKRLCRLARFIHKQTIAEKMRMLQIKAQVGISQVHGFGLIAQEFIAQGSIVWEFRPGFDQAFTEEEFQSLPLAAQKTIHWYGYYDPAHKIYVLSSDDDRFTNHSDDPNTQDTSLNTYASSYAIKDIHPGEEITWDYRPWSGKFFFSNPDSLKSSY